MDIARLLDPCFATGATSFRCVEAPAGAITAVQRDGRPALAVDPALLALMAHEAFRDINFLFRSSQLEAWAAILEDPEASDNDRFTAAALLKNAVIAAEMVLPSCQDTGTATVVGVKGEGVQTGGDDAEALSAGAGAAYAGHNLRFSQVAPVSFLEDEDTRTNLPAQVDLYAAPAGGPGAAEYRLLFVAKGGGSANKTSFSQETRALLTEQAFDDWLRDRVRRLGAAGCPPYHLAVVAGGTSPEENLKILKLATTGALDHLPTAPAAAAASTAPAPWVPFRDPRWEERLMGHARASGLGAQFGGKWLALDARVIRLSRHAASLPVSMGVSCSAHRNALARVGADGAWLEDFDRNPGRFLPKALPVIERMSGAAPRVDLDRPMPAILGQLAGRAPGSMVLLSGPMIVARDAAHARLARLLADGKPLPDWFSRHPVYYAGPANTPPGRVIGSFGPTTGQRMDSYVRSFMKAGASLVMLAKGDRSADVVSACRDLGGFCLGTIGGAAALITQDSIRSAELVAWPELGMEAVRRIVVRDLPAFVVIDNRGGNLYAGR
jgi:fumarate hydratase, class I